VKRWHQEHEHPRGALGLKFDETALKKISDASRKTWERRTPKELEAMRIKRNATKIAKYGSLAPGRTGENVYSRAKRGKREDLGDIFFRSRWEANYARYLKWLLGHGDIAKWEYEPQTFTFHGETRGAITYLPDFRVTENSGKMIYHEVKGRKKQV